MAQFLSRCRLSAHVLALLTLLCISSMAVASGVRAAAPSSGEKSASSGLGGGATFNDALGADENVDTFMKKHP